jgi:hypothetical protein
MDRTSACSWRRGVRASIERIARSAACAQSRDRKIADRRVRSRRHSRDPTSTALGRGRRLRAARGVPTDCRPGDIRRLVTPRVTDRRPPVRVLANAALRAACAQSRDRKIADRRVRSRHHSRDPTSTALGRGRCLRAARGVPTDCRHGDIRRLVTPRVTDRRPPVRVLANAALRAACAQSRDRKIADRRVRSRHHSRDPTSTALGRGRCLRAARGVPTDCRPGDIRRLVTPRVTDRRPPVRVLANAALRAACAQSRDRKIADRRVRSRRHSRDPTSTALGRGRRLRAARGVPTDCRPGDIRRLVTPRVTDRRPPVRVLANAALRAACAQSRDRKIADRRVRSRHHSRDPTSTALGRGRCLRAARGVPTDCRHGDIRRLVTPRVTDRRPPVRVLANAALRAACAQSRDRKIADRRVRSRHHSRDPTSTALGRGRCLRAARGVPTDCRHGDIRRLVTPRVTDRRPPVRVLANAALRAACAQSRDRKIADRRVRSRRHSRDPTSTALGRGRCLRAARGVPTDCRHGDIRRLVTPRVTDRRPPVRVLANAALRAACAQSRDRKIADRRVRSRRHSRDPTSTALGRGRCLRAARGVPTDCRHGDIRRLVTPRVTDRRPPVRVLANAALRAACAQSRDRKIADRRVRSRHRSRDPTSTALGRGRCLRAARGVPTDCRHGDIRRLVTPRVTDRRPPVRVLANAALRAACAQSRDRKIADRRVRSRHRSRDPTSTALGRGRCLRAARGVPTDCRPGDIRRLVTPRVTDRRPPVRVLANAALRAACAQSRDRKIADRRVRSRRHSRDPTSTALGRGRCPRAARGVPTDCRHGDIRRLVTPRVTDRRPPVRVLANAALRASAAHVPDSRCRDFHFAALRSCSLPGSAACQAV